MFWAWFLSSGNLPPPEKTTPGTREPHTKRTLGPRPYREKINQLEASTNPVREEIQLTFDTGIRATDKYYCWGEPTKGYWLQTTDYIKLTINYWLRLLLRLFLWDSLQMFLPAMPWLEFLCHALPCFAMLCYASPCFAVLCFRFVLLCSALLSCAMLCLAMLSFSTLCFTMLCSALLCLAML